MSFYLSKIPLPVQWIVRKVLWRIKKTDAVYLTFDDGPHPEVTPALLALLKKNQAQATFFLVGKNADAYPECVRQIEANGHAIGFHGQHHVNSKSLNEDEFIRNCKPSESFPKTKLFRPPFGKLNFRQYQQVKNNMTLVGWNIMPGDFDEKKSSKKQLAILLEAKPGDIVVLHERFNTLSLLESFFQQTEIKHFKKIE